MGSRVPAHGVLSDRDESVFCQSKRALEVVEQMYADENENYILSGKEAPDLFLEMASAMARQNFIDDHGVQKRRELYGSDAYFEATAAHVEKYTIR